MNNKTFCDGYYLACMSDYYAIAMKFYFWHNDLNLSTNLLINLELSFKMKRAIVSLIYLPNK